MQNPDFNPHGIPEPPPPTPEQDEEMNRECARNLELMAREAEWIEAMDQVKATILEVREQSAKNLRKLQHRRLMLRAVGIQKPSEN